jgi:hypothetical protein
MLLAARLSPQPHPADGDCNLGCPRPPWLLRAARKVFAQGYGSVCQPWPLRYGRCVAACGRRFAPTEAEGASVILVD